MVIYKGNDVHLLNDIQLSVIDMLNWCRIEMLLKCKMNCNMIKWGEFNSPDFPICNLGENVSSCFI